ncbi:MAG: class I SAM-dependent rRNA methyltransferase [Clostridia bacterium]|nr:class I SAM-dependent rRNA methyltransferase [Clostridia bacterium]
MKAERIFPSVTITKKGEQSIRRGHPWVYDTEITSSNGEITNGCFVDVLSSGGSYLGTGLYSAKSKIRVRIMTQNANETFSEAFFERRIRYAVMYRKTVMGNNFSACRLIFGEADEMPGLTVDRYGDILVTQVLSYGMEIRKDMIYRLLISVMNGIGEHISGIYERNDVAIRELEGLPQGKGWYEAEGSAHPERTEVDITENGIKYTVDFENGQKTGFFLDQKYNRAAVARLAKGKNVLDCFTHTGSFALNAAYGGANHVTAVDISELAVENARHNAEVNGLDDRMDFLCADVFDLLPMLEMEKKNYYDFIILDPPAFTKSRKTVSNAEKGYKEINYRAMKLLPRGGYFATCSCSHFMRDDLFRAMLADAARDANVKLRQIEARQQCCDHPVLWNVPETDYLKFYIFQII